MKSQNGINWSVRIANKRFWLMLIPALILVIQAVAAVFGFTLDLSDLGNKLLAVVNSLFAVLAIIGIVNDPTTIGFHDSAEVRAYAKPYNEDDPGAEGSTPETGSINWQVRIANIDFWIALIPAILLLIQSVAAVFGFVLDFTALSDKLLEVVNTVFALLTVLGVVNDPTTKSLSDSSDVLCYSIPYDDTDPENVKTNTASF